MSKYNVIKLLYNFTFTIFHYILWGVLSFIIFNINSDYRTFALAVVMGVFMQYLGIRNLNRFLLFGLPITLSLLILYFMFGLESQSINAIFVIGNMLIMSRSDALNIDYMHYKEKLKRAIYVLILLGLFLLPMNKEIKEYLLRFYIIFLASSIWLLRESRRYCYNVKGKKSLAADIIIMLVLLLLSQKSVFNIVKKLLSSLILVIDYIINKILFVLAIILSKPFDMLIEGLQGLMKKLPEKEQININNNALNNVPKVSEDIAYSLPPSVIIFFKLIIAAALLYIIFKLIMRYKYAANKEILGIVEQRESIMKMPVSKKRLSSLIKEIFMPRSLREQLLKVYEDFEKRAQAKKIFKTHFTATQLYNITKTVVPEADSVWDLTIAYNEAKFSNHKVSEDAVRAAKKNLADIKKQF